MGVTLFGLPGAQSPYAAHKTMQEFVMPHTYTTYTEVVSLSDHSSHTTRLFLLRHKLRVISRLSSIISRDSFQQRDIEHIMELLISFRQLQSTSIP